MKMLSRGQIMWKMNAEKDLEFVRSRFMTLYISTWVDDDVVLVYNLIMFLLIEIF